MKDFFNEISNALNRHLTPAVKTIFLTNILVFLITFILDVANRGVFSLQVAIWFGQDASKPYHLWQYLTYMFIHADPMHLFFNMLSLWFFASDLENRWGTKGFWKFYLTVGIGAGVGHMLLSNLLGSKHSLAIGSSGAIYGIMLAYAAYYPDAIILAFFAFPMKIKHFMAIMLLIEFVVSRNNVIYNSQDNISHITHLSGLIVTYVYLSIYHKEWDIRRWQWR